MAAETDEGSDDEESESDDEGTSSPNSDDGKGEEAR